MEEIQEKQDIQERLVDATNLKGGLEILVQLAEKGEIDPWDVDIIDVTDKYLNALDKTPRENLLNAGRAIFYSSVLLRLKSDVLLNISNETLLNSQQNENFFPEDDLLLNEDGQIPLDLSKLETYIVRSSLGKQQRKRKVTLNDLIYALQQAEEEEERRALRSKLRQERRFTIAMPETPDDVLDIAQDEEVEDIAQKIDLIIQEHLTDEKPITFSFLTSIINYKAKAFLAILFLTHAKKIVINQDEFYNEIYIYRAGTEIEYKDHPSKSKASEIQPKRGFAQKIKDKIKDIGNLIIPNLEKKLKKEKKKIIEITTEGENVIDLNTTVEENKNVN